MSHERFLVVDFGAQYAQLIARRVREQGCYAEIVMPEALESSIGGAKGVIFSGSPWSAYEDGAPHVPQAVFDAGVPILGICYGMQLTVHLLGGRVDHAETREYGRARIEILNGDKLFEGIDGEMDVWMSHGDRVEAAPEGFLSLAKTDHAPFSACLTAAKGAWSGRARSASWW